MVLASQVGGSSTGHMRSHNTALCSSSAAPARCQGSRDHRGKGNSHIICIDALCALADASVTILATLQAWNHHALPSQLELEGCAVSGSALHIPSVNQAPQRGASGDQEG